MGRGFCSMSSRSASGSTLFCAAISGTIATRGIEVGARPSVGPGCIKFAIGTLCTARRNPARLAETTSLPPIFSNNGGIKRANMTAQGRDAASDDMTVDVKADLHARCAASIGFGTLANFAISP